jgi:hypothetical protein
MSKEAAKGEEKWPVEELVSRLENVEEFNRQLVRGMREAPLMVRPPARFLDQLDSLIPDPEVDPE